MEFAELIKTTRVDNAILRKAHLQPVEGTVCLTSHHLIFSSRLKDEDELLILYSNVENVHKKLTATHGTLTILCKDLTSFKLRIPGVDNAQNIASSIDMLSTLDNPSQLYPFFHRLDFEIIEDGWLKFSLDRECKRVLNNCGIWRVSNVNKDYKVCPSYPKAVVVPLAASDDFLLKSAKFRQGGRFPVLSYLHGKDMVPLMRCAQPLNGQGNKRCKEDEKLLNIALAGHGKKGMIIDTRGTAASSSQRSRGGGYELESNYPQWKRSFQNIDRFNTLSDAVAKLYDACTDLKGTSWFSKLENSNWLSMVDALLTSAITVAELINDARVPVLVHGDGGTDMTLAVTALCQLLLNPASRTLDGMQSLIVREWIHAGHPFSDRNIKLGISPVRYKGQGPVFLLFLDCVYQVLRQYPCSFEFNEQFLLFLSEHSCGSPYGTFLFNNESEREHYQLISRTISIWSYLHQPEVRKGFTNILYEENSGILSPSNAPQSLCIWSSMFLKWSLSTGPDDERQMYEKVKVVKEQNLKLKLKARELQKEHEELRQDIIRNVEKRNDRI